MIIIAESILGYNTISGINIVPAYKNQKKLFFRLLKKVTSKLRISSLIINKNRILSCLDTIIVFDVTNYDFLNWLNKKSKAKRIIFWYWNPVFDSLDPLRIPKRFEKWSYSKTDCKKYNMSWNSTFLDFSIMPNVNECGFANNKAVFVGTDKGRIEKLMELSKKLNSNGIETEIIIAKNRKYSFKERKLVNHMSFHDYIINESSGGYIIDFGANDDVGLTLRALESIYYNKKIICNYKEIKCSLIPVSNYFYFKELSDFDTQSFKTFANSNPQKIDQNIINYYSFNEWIKRFNI